VQLHLTEPAIQPLLRMMDESRASCASRPASHDLGRIVLFWLLLIESSHFAHKIIGPKLYQIGSNSPP
jgi:hypothetical protein